MSGTVFLHPLMHFSQSCKIGVYIYIYIYIEPSTHSSHYAGANLMMVNIVWPTLIKNYYL